MKSWIYFVLVNLPGRFLSYGSQSSKVWEDLLQYSDRLRYPMHDTNRLSLRDCSSEVAAFNIIRRERRGHNRRLEKDMQALTCVAAPEVALENYIRPPLRQDIREEQTGIEMILDIGIVDVTTCQPMPNVMVEVWSSNAFGEYGSTFLRGAFTSAANGVAEFQTLFPGYNSDGANHVNLMIHTSNALPGTISHVGQVFFTDRWTDVIAMTSPYNQNTHHRVLNAQDSNYATANSEGYNAIVDIESIHDDWPEGVTGYITVGVNPQRKVGASQ